jgi:hypothetical protein
MLELIHFSKNKKTRDGLMYKCRVCVAAEYAANRTAVRERQRIYYQENRDKILARQRAKRAG